LTMTVHHSWQNTPTTAETNSTKPKWRTTPIFPPSGPDHWLCQGPPAESKLLAAESKLLAARFVLDTE
jgi:hypothetical protein